MTISSLDIAWLAGLLEGEGCFRLHRNTPSLVIHMTDEDVMRRAGKLLGKEPWLMKRYSPGLKPIWSTEVYGSRAVSWMMTVYPLMGGRRRGKIRECLCGRRSAVDHTKGGYVQLEARDFLTLCEQANRLVFFDLETSGLNSDYNSVLVVSLLPFRGKPIVFKVKRAGQDRQVVNEVARELEKYVCWCGFYSKMFDVPFLEGRLLKHRLTPLIRQPHIDLYFHLKSAVKTSRRSQAHYLSWLETGESKMTVGPSTWNEVLNDPEGMPMNTLVKRCTSDTVGLRSLYLRTKQVIRNVSR